MAGSRFARTLLVARYELVSTLRRRSFWAMALLFPAVIIAFALMSQLVAQRSSSSGPDPGTSQTIGFVDQAGLVKRLPPGLDAKVLREYPDEGSAEDALAADAIARYYVLPPDALATGRITRVEPKFQPLASMSVDPILRYVIASNIFDDERKALIYFDPTPDPTVVSLGAPEPADQRPDGPINPMVPYAVVFVMFFVITTTGGFMLQSVSREKESRTAEILLLSVTPRDMMMGKLLGLTAVALVQIGFWAGAVVLALDQVREMFDLAVPRGLAPSAYVFGALFFLLGYLMYSSALGALGAIAPNSREGGQLTMVVLLPLFIPMFLNGAIALAPNGVIALTMSLFPLTAPPAMAARLVMTTVPWWQLGVGLAGLAVTTFLMVSLSARFFRADNLLSSAGVTLARVRSGFARRPSA